MRPIEILVRFEGTPEEANTFALELLDFVMAKEEVSEVKITVSCYGGSIVVENGDEPPPEEGQSESGATVP